jgi:hypothetical protein
MDAQQVKERMNRFFSNEERVDIFANDPEEAGFYETNTDPLKQVETLPHFMGRIDAAAAETQDMIKAAAAETQDTINRMLLSAEVVRTLRGLRNMDIVWETPDALLSGEILTLPAWYVVGGAMFTLHCNGVKCYRAGEAGITQFEEVGSPDSPSNQVRLLFGVEAGARWNAWFIGDNIGWIKDNVLPKRIDVILPADVAPAEEIAVPEYLVGSKLLTVYVDGRLLVPGVHYEEVGEEGEVSESIKMLESLDSGVEFTAIVSASSGMAGEDAGGGGGTPSIYLNAPVITSPANEATGVSTMPLIAFAEPDYDGQYVATFVVHLSLHSDFSTITWADTVPYISIDEITPPVNLAASTTYYVRLAFAGSVTGRSDWSETVSFTTASVAVNETIDLPSGDWTPPIAGTWRITVKGGGGGGAYCGLCFMLCSCGVNLAGGHGGVDQEILVLDADTPVPVTVGGGGAYASGGCRGDWGSSRPCGGAGGASSCGAYVSATGGAGRCVYCECGLPSTIVCVDYSGGEDGEGSNNGTTHGHADNGSTSDGGAGSVTATFLGV